MTPITDAEIAELRAGLEGRPGYVKMKAETVRALLARLDAAEGELTRMTNNRDMWKGQCERQADSLMKLRVSGIALLEASRLVSAYGAQTGSQWVKLSAAIPQMSAALSLAKAER